MFEQMAFIIFGRIQYTPVGNPYIKQIRSLEVPKSPENPITNATYHHDFGFLYHAPK